MADYPVTREMPNGASVADWLGTAKTAAEYAATLIERVRSGKAIAPEALLDRAELQLEQAANELLEVRQHIGR